MATFTPAQFAAAGGKANSQTTDYSPLQDFLKQNVPGAVQPSAPQQQNNPASAVAGDALSTLIAKPGTRIAQAAVAPLQLQTSQSTTDIQNEQTDTLNKVLDHISTETDPIKKQALITMAKQLVQQATPNTEAGQQANSEGSAISGNTHILGQDIQGQEGGMAGVKQIAGDALKSASYLAAPELSEGAIGAPTAAGKILAGAGSGSILGAAAGAGSELQDPNSTLQSVTNATGQGMKTGALIGAAIPAAGEAFKGVQNAAEDFANRPETPKTIKLTPEMQAAHDKLIQAQQAFDEAKAKANIATTERQQGVENAKSQIAKTQAEAQSSIEQSKAEVAKAQQARSQATPEAVKGASDIQSGVKSGERAMGATFGKAPAQIEATDPSARYNLSQKDLTELNSIKEDRKFALPDYLNQENNPQPTIAGQTLDTSKMNPEVRAQIEKATGQMQGETAKALTPTQTQDLIKQINSKVYNPGTGEVDQRLVDLSNRIKSGAQSSFGHIVDENGESVWNKAYQNFSKGMDTSDNLKTLMGVNPNKDLTDISPNKILEKVNDLGKTPEGKVQLQQIANEFKANSGVDLTKPIKNVQQIADAEDNLKRAQSTASETQKNAEGKISEAQKNASQTTKSLVKNELATREEVQARKADIIKAQAEIDKMEKAKLTTPQKIAQLTKSKGLKWADYALRFIVIRELYKAITAKPSG